jgi:DNA-binding transcriptional ArsR family regulator
MSGHVAFIDELARALTGAVEHRDWRAAKAALSGLAEQIVGTLIERREEDIPGAYDAVERAYTILVTKDGPEEDTFTERSAVSELQAFGRVLSIALQYRRSPKASDIVAGLGQEILEALRDAPRGLSGRQLVEGLGRRADVIARKLPQLRAARLVDSRKVGRETINRLTPEGERLLGLAAAKPVVKRMTQSVAAPPALERQRAA